MTEKPLRIDLALWLCACGIAHAQQGPHIANPALRRFSDRVLFLASFDDGQFSGEMAVGEHAPLSVTDDARATDGLFGKALTGGQVVYRGAANLPLATTGSVVFWVCPLDWRERDREGYLWWFQSLGKGRLLIGRQGQWRKPKRPASVYFHANAPGDKRGLGTHISRQGGWHDWPNHTWHLVVVNWTVGRMEISVDGGPLRGRVIGRLGDCQRFSVAGKQPDGSRYLLDDLMVLDRPLSGAEINWVWRTMVGERAE